jgi:hypothetical protein
MALAVLPQSPPGTLWSRKVFARVAKAKGTVNMRAVIIGAGIAGLAVAKAAFFNGERPVSRSCCCRSSPPSAMFPDHLVRSIERFADLSN